jgi:exosortase
MSLTRRTVFLALYCVAVAAVNAPSMRALYEHSQRDNTASHVFLIPLISIGLIVMRRAVVFRSPETSWRVGGLAIAAGAALLAATAAMDAASLSARVLPVVVLWIAGFILFFGANAARTALFPLLFLAFTVPIPDIVLKAANDFLKAGSTEVVASLFTITGTPHIRSGFVFQLPFIAIEVADACSGIRSSIGLLITSLLAGYMFLAKVHNRLLLLLAIVPITIFKNGVRIVTLSLLSIHVDPSYLSGQLHHEGGIVFFMISLALLTPILLLLMRSERRRGDSDGQSRAVPAGAVTGVATH